MPRSPNPDTQFISITDFRLGIMESSTNYSLHWQSTGILGDFTQIGTGTPQPMPPGSCEGDHTWGCAATNDGGLMALPGFTPFGLPPATALTGGTVGGIASGMKVLGPISGLVANPSPTDAVMIAFNYSVGGTTNFSLCSFAPSQASLTTTQAGNAANWTLNIAHTAGAFGGGVLYGVSMDTTRIQSGATYYPVLVFEVSDLYPSNPTSMFCGFTPALAGAWGTSTGFTSGGTGPIFTHQNRTVQLRQQLIGAYGFNLNENIFYTDPALTSTTFTAAASIFVAEAPSNIGVWGSISSGELLLIKQQGGGLIMSGDFNNPTITRLPGIRSPGNITMKGVQTPIGIVYITDFDGAWVWNGSNTSQKISRQIDPSRLTKANLGATPSLIGGQTEHLDFWNDWVFFAQGTLYDFNLNSWWRYFNTYEDYAIDTWAKSASSEQYMYGVSTRLGPPWLLQLTKGMSLTSFAWRSNALPPTVDREVSLTEYEIGVAVPPPQPANIGGLQAFQVPLDYFLYIQTQSWDGSSNDFDTQLFNSTTRTVSNLPRTYLKLRGKLGTKGQAIQAQLEVGLRSCSNLLTFNESTCATTASFSIGGAQWQPNANVALTFATNPVPNSTGQGVFQTLMTANGGGPISITTRQTHPDIAVITGMFLAFSTWVFSLTVPQTWQIVLTFFDSAENVIQTLTGPSISSVVGSWARIPFSQGGNEIMQITGTGNISYVGVDIQTVGTPGNGEQHSMVAPFLMNADAYYTWSALNMGSIPLTTGVLLGGGNWYTGGYTIGGLRPEALPNVNIGVFNRPVSPIIHELHLGYHETHKVA